jgi:sterol desaturase/sphingolipid hydroxylase (fatty acid hydroxylase superfamily)
MNGSRAATEYQQPEQPEPVGRPVTATGWKAFLLSLPQPLAVFGMGFLMASAAVYGWIGTGALTGIIFLTVVPTLLLLELLFPRRKDWKLNWGDFALDMFWFITVAVIWVPLFDEYWETPISRGFEWLSEASAWPFALHAESMLGLVAAAVFAMVVKEFIYYWIHRFQHRYMLMWRMHATHHHIEKMSAARADRTHPTEFLLLTIGSVITLAFFQASPEVIAVYVSMTLTNAYFCHANLPVRSGIYGWLFTTAEYHHLHHSLNREESDTNFGCTIILWDRVFGTFKGVADNGTSSVSTVGNGTGKPLSLYMQFTMPFRSDETLRKL